MLTLSELMDWGWRIISGSCPLKEGAVQFARKLRQKSAEILPWITTMSQTLFGVCCVLIVIGVLSGVIGWALIHLVYCALLLIIWIANITPSMHL